MGYDSYDPELARLFRTHNGETKFSLLCIWLWKKQKNELNKVLSY